MTRRRAIPTQINARKGASKVVSVQQGMPALWDRKVR